MDKNASKSNCYLTYWKKKQVETENFYRRLESEAKNELDNIASLLVDKYGVSRILLFGSLKTGGFTENSDIDLAVEGINAEDFFAALAEVNRLSRFVVDLKPLEDLEPYFRSRIHMEGKLIYEEDNHN